MENLINKDMPCSSYCWLANRYAIVSQIPDYIYYICDELNMAILEENNRIHFIGKNCSKVLNSHFTNLLNFSELNSLEILQFCEESLNNNKYILIKVDKFYIKACSQYNDKHEFYEILIYGKNKNEFYFLNLCDRTKLWDTMTLSADELFDGSLSALNLRNNNYNEYLKIFEGNESLCVNVQIKKNIELYQNTYEFLLDVFEIGRYFGSSDEMNSVAGNHNIDYLTIYLKALVDIRIMFIKKMYLLSSVDVSYYINLCEKIVSIYKKRLIILVRHSIKFHGDVKSSLIEETMELINKSEKQLWTELYNGLCFIR